MPIKRVRESTSPESIIVRETLTIGTGENGEAATLDELRIVAEELADNWTADIEKGAQTILRQCGLPEVWGRSLREAVANRLHSREWYAAEALRGIALIHWNLANHSSPWPALQTALRLGNTLAMAGIKLELEADVLTGRRHRAASARGGAERKTRSAPARQRTGELIEALIREGESRSDARGIIARRENISTDRARKRHNDYIAAIQTESRTRK